FERDVAGRVVKETGFDGRLIVLRYDRAGRCCEMVNAQERRTKIECDGLGRGVKQIVPRKPVMGDPLPKGEDDEHTYEARGRLVGAKNEACEIAFTRDALGRVIEERSTPLAPTEEPSEVAAMFARMTGLVEEKPALGNMTPISIESRYDAAGAR